MRLSAHEASRRDRRSLLLFSPSCVSVPAATAGGGPKTWRDAGRDAGQCGGACYDQEGVVALESSYARRECAYRKALGVGKKVLGGHARSARSGLLALRPCVGSSARMTAWHARSVTRGEGRPQRPGDTTAEPQHARAPLGCLCISRTEARGPPPTVRRERRDAPQQDAKEGRVARALATL